jgi:parallel beta-helix repeat protein
MVPCLALLALVTVLVMTFVGSSGASAACTMPNPPANGDWIIYNGDICTPTAGPWTVNGNIEIQNNGNLTLNGVRVQMASASPGQRTIYVRTGGTFNIFSGSTITATNQAFHYKFLVEKGAKVQMSGSTVEYCGIDLSSDDAFGMRIQSNQVTITKSTFRFSYAGVYIKDASPSIDNSTFQNDMFGIEVAGSQAKPTIYDSHILNNQEGIMINDALPTIGNNEVGLNGDCGLSLLRSNANIFGNDIHNNTFGIYLQSSSPTIKGNTIRGGKDGIRGFFGNPIIKGNTLHDEVRVLIYLSNTGGSVEGNTLRGLDDPASTANGVYLVTATTLVKGNTFLKIGMYAVALMAGSSVTVTGNNMNLSEFGVLVQGSSIKMDHNTLDQNAIGVSLNGADGSIKDNTILGGIFGIDASYVNRTMIIEHNTLKIYSTVLNTTFGIILHTGNPIISNNTITHSDFGIRALNSRPRLLFNNITDDRTGLDVDRDSDVYAEGNHFMKGNKSMTLSWSRATLVNNIVELSTNWSVYVANNSYVRMVGNQISGNEQKGAYFIRSEGWLSNNTFSSSGTGIYALKSKLTMDHNNISKDEDGLFLQTTPVTMDGDIIRNCTTQAIMADSSDLNLNAIQMYDNELGLYVFGGNVNINNSIFEHNKIGIWLWQDPHVSITGGRVSKSFEASLKLQDLGTIMVKGLSVLNNTGKFEISTPSIDISSLTYLGNQKGIEVNSVWLDLADSTFSMNNDSALRLLGSHVVVVNSTFDDNVLGLELDNSTLDISHSKVMNSNESGIQSQNSMVRVRDTIINRNKDGIFEMGGSSFDIFNCNISSNKVFGLYTTDKSKSVVVNYTRKIINEDNIFMIHGSMIVAKGGQLYLLRSNLEFWSETPGESGVTIMTGAQMTMRENVVYAYTHDVGYYFNAQPGSVLTISNVTFRHCGRGMTGASKGLEVMTDKAYLSDIFFEDNEVGLHVVNANITAYTLRFNANTEGMLVENGEVYLVSSKFNASTDKDIILMVSTARLLDTTMTISKVDIHDPGSLLVVMWYLKVTVVWNDGQPVNGASVNITDKGNAVQVAITDAQGNTPRFIVTEYQQKGPDSANRIYLTPHDIKASVNQLTVDKGVNVVSSMSVKVVMIDDKPPVVKVTAPIAGEIMYTGSILFAGTAHDEGSSVASVELSLDGKNWFTANGTTSWSSLMTLSDGPQTVKIRATDARGNSIILIYNVEVDLSSPLLVIYHPLDGAITNSTNVTISGKVHQGAQLLINNVPINIDNNGTFTYPLNLNEGQNHIHFKAISKDGKLTMDRDIVVTRDMAPPKITLLHPVEGAYINRTAITVTVVANEEVTFYINGQAVNTFAGKADGVVQLQEGKNTIYVKAVDLAGNQNFYQFSVTRDTVKPDLVLTKPPAVVFSTTNDKLTILGRTEIGANLTLDKKTLAMDAHGNFTIKKGLKVGKNSFTITSQDKAGNANVLVLEVTRKQVVDYTPYYALFVFLAIMGIVGDIGTVIYFRKYYVPKGPEAKTGGELSEEESEEKELTDSLEGEEGWDKPKAGQRRYQKRPPPPMEEAEETEFEEVEDLGEF